MELAVDYDRPIRGDLRWQLYGGLSGEPALGPAAFPHRPSATPNPMAPITHHWLDSTHIAFGLVTAGIYDARWKAEVSIFNGREPDELRHDLDLGPLDSVSGRLSVMVTPDLVFQASAGFLREAEDEFPPQPRSDLFRFTTSASYHRSGDRELDVTAAFGLNSGDEVIPGDVFRATTPAGLVEGVLTLRDRRAIFTRAELVWKPAHDLHAHEYATDVFPMGKLQGGYVEYLPPWKSMRLGVGGTMAVAVLPPELAPRYGGTFAPEFGVFAVVRPARHRPMAMPPRP
jgi:hypothetical protein